MFRVVSQEGLYQRKISCQHYRLLSSGLTFAKATDEQAGVAPQRRGYRLVVLSGGQESNLPRAVLQTAA